MKVLGADLVARALQQQGVDTFFFIMGAPMSAGEKASIDIGIRGIDVRHEQAAAMMAHAYARVSNKPGVCMACSGPGTANLSSGLANALVDCAPVVAFGGSSPVNEYQQDAFQEIDQVAMLRPVVKWAVRVYDAARIPEYINRAFRTATAGKPGPVYLDFPSDVLYAEVEESQVVWPVVVPEAQRARPVGDPELVAKAADILAEAKRPLIVTGSGVFWSDAADIVQRWVDATGMPFYTTPQGRGVVPEDHPFFYPNARSSAMREADVVLVVGTRLNYVFGRGMAPRFSKSARLIRIDVDPQEIASSAHVEVGIIGDARCTMEQLLAAVARRVSPDTYKDWRARLDEVEAEKAKRNVAQLESEDMPIHPLRLCKEVRDVIPRDAILTVDGQEILNYGRQSIPTFVSRHRLNSGPFGMMGVGLPFGLGAKAASPDKTVVVLHGDGSFAMNGVELDTAVRHNLPVLVVISLNGGWTADPEGIKPGRHLGYTRFHEFAQSFDCAGEYVERPEDIRPALERALKIVQSGRTAIVNVKTDELARADTVKFTKTMT